MSILKTVNSGSIIKRVISFSNSRNNKIDFKGIRVSDFSTMHPQIPRPLIFCGPSGSGKSTLIQRLMDDFPDRFGFTVSHTTRPPRPGEVHGKHYYFTDEATMKKAIENGHFIEHAVFSENTYGTSFEAVEQISRAGRVVIMDIDVQGIKQIKKTSLNPWYVFVQPPTVQDLRRRLIKRKTESEESLERRLSKAREEINYGLIPDNFHKVLVNDNLDKTYKELKEFVEEKVLSHKYIGQTTDES